MGERRGVKHAFVSRVVILERSEGSCGEEVKSLIELADCVIWDSSLRERFNQDDGVIQVKSRPCELVCKGGNIFIKIVVLSKMDRARMRSLIDG